MRKVTANTTLIRLGDVPSFIYVIVHGSVRLSVPLGEGREFIFSDLGRGDVFGLSSCFVARHSIMNAAALFDSEFLQIDAAFARSLLAKHPELAYEIIPFFCRAVQEGQKRVIESATHTLSVRLASTILRITDEQPNSSVRDTGRQSIRVSQTDLAAMVPASREKVNRCLREWERRALVRFDRGLLTIINRGALKSIALARVGDRMFDDPVHRKSLFLRSLHGYN